MNLYPTSSSIETKLNHEVLFTLFRIRIHLRTIFFIKNTPKNGFLLVSIHCNNFRFQYNGLLHKRYTVDAIWTSLFFLSIISSVPLFFDHVSIIVTIRQFLKFSGIYDLSQLDLKIVERYDGKDPFTRDSFTENGEWQIVANRTFRFEQKTGKAKSVCE